MRNFDFYLDRATASLKEGFATKAAKKAANDDLNRAYDKLRDAVLDETSYAVDLPYGLHQVREKHLAVVADYGLHQPVAQIRTLMKVRAEVTEAEIVPVKSKAELEREAVEEAKSDSPIIAAIAPLKKMAVDAAESRAREFAEARFVELEQAGWDLNVVAPFPSFRASREEYNRAQNKRSAYSMITSRTDYVSRPGDPEIVERDDAKVEIFVEQSQKIAAASYEAYASKLVMKVGEVTEASVRAVSGLWGQSILTVTKPDGEVQRWKTQMILNVSVYGKLFNQWPTRKLK